MARVRIPRALTVAAACWALCLLVLSAQQPPPPPTGGPAARVPVLEPARPVLPPKHPLPPEAKSASEKRFSFIVYGDTRAPSAAENAAPYPAHERVMDTILAAVKARARTRFPVRFVLQTGDAVIQGASGRMWNNSFTPTLERLTRGADIPYFLAAGNHDVTGLPPGAPGREQALHTTLSAMSQLIPPEGSPRRLNGYLTYAIGYGNVFAIAIDSNVAADPVQRAWVTDQLDHLDRRRFPIVVAVMHHPPYSSGPHGTARNLEAATLAVRNVYMPLFRRHHVRLIAAGHEHMFEQWVERYEEAGMEYRMDTIVTGGGGAPTYTYRGEPDLTMYLAAGAAEGVRVTHLAKPGATLAESPNHIVVITVDDTRLSEEVIAAGDARFAPFNGQSRIDLTE
jgi:3',5'-cyclic AMP phosphodiesterase CpdA